VPGPQILTVQTIKLREDGWSMSRIAREFGVSTEAVSKFIQSRRPDLCGRFPPVNGTCEICGFDGIVEADHKHIQGQHHQRGSNRGLLCRPCNIGLGQFKDSKLLLLSAISYLERHAEY